jgi:hypothetical protein
MAQSPPGDDDRITRPFELRPYDPVSDREKIRGRLAQILIWAVVGATAGALLLLAIGRITVQDLPAVAGVASPLAGIAGAAIGFYFGGEEPRRG